MVSKFQRDEVVHALKERITNLDGQGYKSPRKKSRGKLPVERVSEPEGPVASSMGNLIDALQTAVSTNQSLVQSFSSRTDDFGSDLKSVSAHVSAAEGAGQDVSAIKEAVIELTNTNFQLGNQVRTELAAQDNPLHLVTQISNLHEKELSEL